MIYIKLLLVLYIMRYTYKLVIRLILMLIVAFLFPYVYIILNPLTLNISYYLLQLFVNASLINSSIMVNNITLNFINACSAGAAYLLLIFLILSTKALSFKKMLLMFLIGASLIFIMNIVRIEILIWVLLDYGLNMFDNLHLFFWRGVSTIFVALIWFFLDIIFKLKTIPIISDVKYLVKAIQN